MPGQYMQGVFYDVYVIIYGITSPATVSIYIDGSLASKTVIQPGKYSCNAIKDASQISE